MKTLKISKKIVIGTALIGLVSVVGVKSYDHACVSECVDKLLQQTGMCASVMAALSAGLWTGLLGGAICGAGALIAYEICTSLC